MKGRLAFLETWYESVKRLAGHRRASPALFVVSFAESSFFPIPPDVMLIPMVQSRPDRWWQLALLCTVASVLGAIFGYALGYVFFDAVMEPLLARMGKTESMESFGQRVSEYGAMGVFGAALTPFPFKVITVMSGALKLNFGVFLAACVVGRAARFFLVAGIVRKFGGQAEQIMKERFGLFTTLVFVALACGWWLLHSL